MNRLSAIPAGEENRRMTWILPGEALSLLSEIPAEEENKRMTWILPGGSDYDTKSAETFDGTL